MQESRLQRGLVRIEALADHDGGQVAAHQCGAVAVDMTAQPEDAAVGGPLGQARILRGALKVSRLRLMVALVDRRGRDLPLLVQRPRPGAG